MTIVQDPPAPAVGHVPSRSWGAVIGLALGLTALLSVLLTAFAWPASQTAPRDVPLALVGPAPVTSAIEDQLAADGAFDVTVVADRDEAVAAIEDREVYGALVITPAGSELLTAPAGSPMVAQLLVQGVTAMAAEQGTPPPAVTEVVPLPTDDPRGAAFAAGALPLVLGGLATAVLVSTAVAGRGRQLVAVGSVAVLSGLALTAVLQLWFGALTGSYLANAGVVALGISAMALPLLGLRNVLGMPGLGLGAAVMLLIGNPFSGLASAPELLPSGWSSVGQWLPPGAIGQALRSTAYFDGAAAGWPLLILAGWACAGALLLAIPRRSSDSSAA